MQTNYIKISKKVSVNKKNKKKKFCGVVKVVVNKSMIGQSVKLGYNSRTIFVICKILIYLYLLSSIFSFSLVLY
jgi:hypothetical protein